MSRKATELTDTSSGITSSADVGPTACVSSEIFGLSPSAKVLLRLCAAPESDLAGHFNSLGEDDWYDLVEQAIPKRVAALLDRALERADCFMLMPEECRDAMVAERKRLAMSAFGHMIALCDAVTFLKSHNIPVVALKGVRLAHRDYPDARLRPCAISICWYPRRWQNIRNGC